jgi:hypothetical protein
VDGEDGEASADIGDGVGCDKGDSPMGVGCTDDAGLETDAGSKDGGDYGDGEPQDGGESWSVDSSLSSWSRSTSHRLFAALRVCFAGRVLAGVGGERADEKEAGDGAGGPVATTVAAWPRLQRWRQRLAGGAVPARDGVGRLQETKMSCELAEWCKLTRARSPVAKQRSYSVKKSSLVAIAIAVGCSCNGLLIPVPP